MSSSPSDAANAGGSGASSRAGAPAFILPRFVRAIVSRLPAYPPAVVCALALSAAAPRLFGRDGLADLDGKTFRIAVRDTGASVAFRIRRSRIEPLGGAAAADVTFTACAADYLLLATRRTDPDTLFFERRLLIEGDTETGLRLKNLLDAVELPRWLSGQ